MILPRARLTEGIDRFANRGTGGTAGLSVGATIFCTGRNVTLDKVCTELNELSLCQMTRADLTHSM